MANFKVSDRGVIRKLHPAMGKALLLARDVDVPATTEKRQARYNRMQIAALAAQRELMAEGAAGASADSLRAEGWAVAVHNDYRQNGEFFTFWLFTRGRFAIKGEGRTDAEALRQARESADRIERGENTDD